MTVFRLFRGSIYNRLFCKLELQDKTINHVVYSWSEDFQSLESGAGLYDVEVPIFMKKSQAVLNTYGGDDAIDGFSHRPSLFSAEPVNIRRFNVGFQALWAINWKL